MSLDQNIHELIRMSDTIDELQFTANSLRGHAVVDQRIFADLLQEQHLISLQRVSIRLRVQDILSLQGASYTAQNVQEEIQQWMNFSLTPQGVPKRIILPKSIPLTTRQVAWVYQGYVLAENGGYNIPVLELSQVQLESLTSIYRTDPNGGEKMRLINAAMRVKYLKEILEVLNATPRVPLTPPATANILKPTTLRF